MTWRRPSSTKALKTATHKTSNWSKRNIGPKLTEETLITCIKRTYSVGERGSLSRYKVALHLTIKIQKYQYDSLRQSCGIHGQLCNSACEQGNKYDPINQLAERQLAERLHFTKVMCSNRTKFTQTTPPIVNTWQGGYRATIKAS